MSAESAQREPTMEEILASIRRIISEEDKPGDSGGDVLDLKPPPAPVAETKAPIVAPQPAPKPAPIPDPPKAAPVAAAPTPAPVVFEEPEEIAPSRPLDDELMIVEREDEPAPAPIPAPVAAASKPAPQPEWTPPPQPSRPLVSDPVANQTSNALGRLMGSMMINSGNTLDDVVRELLKPLLKEWLDVNLPSLVEAEVAKEIDRIRRMSR